MEKELKITLNEDELLKMHKATRRQEMIEQGYYHRANHKVFKDKKAYRRREKHKKGYKVD
jgi:hypothetical protein